MWLHPTLELRAALAFLAPYPAEHMTMYPVSTRVNSAKIDDAELIARAA